jgi:hypothetical protein
MIVPQYWAEARIQRRVGDSQYTVRRFGWSDESQGAAQALADARVHEAITRVISGEKLPRRERKVPYNGSEGVPIREEILSRHGSVVITRNSYGARCLNTPDVLMADVDFEKPESFGASCIVTLALGTAAFLTGVFTHSSKRGALYALVALFAAPLLVWLVTAVSTGLKGGREKAARRKFDRFARTHPDWRLRLYRTPAGFRVMATHRLFDPLEDGATRLFEALDTDKMYVRMCRNQRCFRARLTAKPWRAGVAERLRPRGAAWPVAPEHLPRRCEWITAYEERARDFAACRFVTETGDSAEHLAARDVRHLHDEICQALSDLPLA